MSFATGKSSLILDTNRYNTFLVVQSYNSTRFSYMIPINELSTLEIDFTHDSSSQSSCVRATTPKITNQLYCVNSSDVTSSSTITLYGKRL